MKQIPLTPEITKQLQAALGPDVDVSGFAVFESISLSDKPLPGKRGRLFHKAVVVPSTLLAMVRSINEGNHLPLMIDHNLDGAPKGRAFHAGLNYADDVVELRTLFYVDPTEVELIAKINNGTYDEVSVQFLAEKILCSECGWDYRGEGSTWENLLSMTCGEGHTVGEDGVHVRLSGLEEFIELSLVARGAADNPKIVGKSSSKLAPETRERLAAKGFEDLDALICRASLGEDNVSNVDVNKLIADLSDLRGDLKVRDNTITTLTSERDDARGQVTTLQGTITERDATIVTLTTERDQAVEASRAEDADAAIIYLSNVLKKVRVAAGRDEGEVPTTVAELTAAIDEETSELTAILPVGGVGESATQGKDVKDVRSFSAFKLSN